jgi:hypothetical protein
MIERHNPFIDFLMCFSCNLAEQRRSTQVLAAGAKERREREREKCIYSLSLKTGSSFLGCSWQVAYLGFLEAEWKNIFIERYPFSSIEFLCAHPSS